ncbi:MAG: TIGR01841 family phasin [Rhizobiaceae bacterium]|nr:TIGR01841 family phasin [Rhizobiaceae bacterium]MCV0407160.1 TIGR01841 family phasin [Rhizobiaceae bacterium]
MAKKPEPTSFIDMFARMGQDLKLPPVDIERVIESNRRNLEALQQSAQAASGGASRMMLRQQEMLRETLAEISQMAQSYREPGSPQDLMAKQAEFARRSFETAVKNTAEMADMARKSSEESIEVLRRRIKESMEEIRDSYDKKSS